MEFLFIAHVRSSNIAGPYPTSFITLLGKSNRYQTKPNLKITKIDLEKISLTPYLDFYQNKKRVGAHHLKHGVPLRYNYSLYKLGHFYP